MKKRKIFLINLIGAIIFLAIIISACLILNMLYSIANSVNPFFLIILVCYVLYKFLNLKWKEE